MLQAGATSVELYSGFIYRGWDVAGKINASCCELLGPTSVRELATAVELIPSYRSAGVAPPNA